MTARLFSAPLDPQFLFAAQSHPRSSRRPPKNQQNQRSPNSETDPGSGFINEDGLWTALLAAMPLGVMVLTHLLELVYCNKQAKSLCDRLQDQNDGAVPNLVRELCQRLIAEEVVVPEPLVMEYQGVAEQFFRLQVKWVTFSGRTLLVVFWEDCHASLQEEFALEQAKYELTGREAEVWFLLRQEYSYQEISDLLNITLNTVKTHAKNIYAKRKNLADKRKIWYSR